MDMPFLTNLNPQSKEIQLYSLSCEKSVSAYWSLCQYQLQVQGSVPCQTVAKKRKTSLTTSDGAAGSDRQGDTCMSKECKTRNEDHEVDLRLLLKASETPKAKGSYSMISFFHSDSSYTMDPC